MTTTRPSSVLWVDQLVGGAKLDVFDIAPELGHQLGPPLDDARPTGEVVEDLVDDVVGDDIEEVLAVDEVAQRPANQIEVGLGGLVGGVIRMSAFWILQAFHKVAGALLRPRPL